MVFLVVPLRRDTDVEYELNGVIDETNWYHHETE